MSEATLEIEGSDEPSIEVEQSAVKAIPAHKKRIGPLAIALIAVAIAVGAWFLINRRSKSVAHQQPISDSGTSSSFVTLSPEQQAAVAVEVAQRRTLQSDVITPGRIAFNSNRVTPVFSQFSVASCA